MFLWMRLHFKGKAPRTVIGQGCDRKWGEVGPWDMCMVIRAKQDTF